MTEEELDIAFKAAVEKATNTTQEFPPDVHLYFYAYYKRALGESTNFTPTSENDLRYAFVQNAFFQVRNLTKEEAKLKYIETVNKHVKG